MINTENNDIGGDKSISETAIGSDNDSHEFTKTGDNLESSDAVGELDDLPINSGGHVHIHTA